MKQNILKMSKDHSRISSNGQCPEGFRTCGKKWGEFDYYKSCVKQSDKCPINDIKFVELRFLEEHGVKIYEKKIENDTKNYDWQYIKFDDTYAIGVQTQAYKYPLVSVLALEKPPCLNLKYGQISYQTDNDEIINSTNKFILEKSEA